MKQSTWKLLVGTGVLMLFAHDAGFAAGARAPKVAPVSVNDLGMPRHQIARDDSLLWIFNGRGKCNPLRYSLTGFSGLNHVEGDGGYRFRFDFLEKRSGLRLLDNVPEIMNTEDPLGWNFRAGTPLCVLAQNETWYPHYYRRVGTFHKHFKTGTVSFAIETRTYVLLCRKHWSRHKAPTAVARRRAPGNWLRPAFDPDAGLATLRPSCA
jgi:hypothetical protein